MNHMKRIYTTVFMFLLCTALLLCGCTQKETETNDNQEPAAPAEQTASILYAELKETNSWEEWQRWQIVTYHIPRKGRPYFGLNYEMPVAWMPLVEPEVA